MWIFPKIANYGVFDRFLAKNALKLSGDAVPTEHTFTGLSAISVNYLYFDIHYT